jgi:prepilin-type N-terminal cleavage/methylation domain-containing protein
MCTAAGQIRRGRWMMRPRQAGFSLIEVAIVVIIIAVIGAIAIPKMSRGADGASDASLTQDLATLRSALDLYQSEHCGRYPAAGAVADALMNYTDDQGHMSGTKDATHVLGPYLRSVPPLPVGPRRGGTKIAAADGSDVGWIYNASTGAISANTTTEVDVKGIAFNAY